MLQHHSEIYGFVLSAFLLLSSSYLLFLFVVERLNRTRRRGKIKRVCATLIFSSSFGAIHGCWIGVNDGLSLMGSTVTGFAMRGIDFTSLMLVSVICFAIGFAIARLNRTHDVVLGYLSVSSSVVAPQIFRFIWNSIFPGGIPMSEAILMQGLAAIGCGFAVWAARQKSVRSIER